MVCDKKKLETYWKFIPEKQSFLKFNVIGKCIIDFLFVVWFYKFKIFLNAWIQGILTVKSTYKSENRNSDKNQKIYIPVYHK